MDVCLGDNVLRANALTTERQKTGGNDQEIRERLEKIDVKSITPRINIQFQQLAYSFLGDPNLHQALRNELLYSVLQVFGLSMACRSSGNYFTRQITD
jgi:hypothetical protein